MKITKRQNRIEGIPNAGEKKKRERVLGRVGDETRKKKKLEVMKRKRTKKSQRKECVSVSDTPGACPWGGGGEGVEEGKEERTSQKRCRHRIFGNDRRTPKETMEIELGTDG